MPLLQHAVEREPGQAGFRLNLAEGLAQTGKPDRAMVELGLIIATDPTNAAALSRFYALESDTLIARRDWQKLYVNGVAWTKADPKAPGAWRMLARGALEEGWHVEATTAFARFLMLTKPTVADFTAYASLCLQALDVETAVKALDRAEQLDPNFPQMLAQRALVLMYLGRFAEAEAYCRRCLQQKPDFVPAYSTLSRLRRGALDDADLKRLNELARRDDVYLDNRIAAIFAIADAHDARGETDIAFAAYEGAHRYAHRARRAREALVQPGGGCCAYSEHHGVVRAVAGDRVAGECAAADLHRRHAALRHDADRRRVGCALAGLRVRRPPGDASDLALADGVRTDGAGGV